MRRNTPRVVSGTMLVGLAMAVTGGVSHAQNTPATVNPLAVKVGIYLPSERAARQAGSDRILALDAEYTIQTLPGSNAVSTLGVGYIERNDLRIIPVTIGELYKDPGRGGGYDYYYGAGLGVYFTRLRSAGNDPGNKGLFGGFVTAGLDLPGAVFAEAKFHYVSKYNDNFVGGLQFSIGKRF